MAMKKPLEKDIQQQILSYLSLRRIFAWRNNNAGVRRTDKYGREFWTFAGLQGVADILGVLPGGLFLAVEVKRPGEEPTAGQEEFLARVRAAGGVAVCAHSLDELITALKEYQ